MIVEKRWKMHAQQKETALQLASCLDCSPLLAQLILNRNIIYYLPIVTVAGIFFEFWWLVFYTGVIKIVLYLCYLALAVCF